MPAASFLALPGSTAAIPDLAMIACEKLGIADPEGFRYCRDAPTCTSTVEVLRAGGKVVRRCLVTDEERHGWRWIYA